MIGRVVVEWTYSMGKAYSLLQMYILGQVGSQSVSHEDLMGIPSPPQGCTHHHRRQEL